MNPATILDHEQKYYGVAHEDMSCTKFEFVLSQQVKIITTLMDMIKDLERMSRLEQTTKGETSKKEIVMALMVQRCDQDNVH